MQKCDDCGHIRFPIGPACTKCLSPHSTWTGVSRHGKVLSHLVFHRGYTPDWRTEVPYSVVMLQLPEGPRLFLDVVDPDKKLVEADLVGQQVRITFDTMADGVGVPRALYEAPMQEAHT
nr:OB-fold domain-containing protein [Microvirga antarctica]